MGGVNDLSENFLFQKIIVKKKTFLDCFKVMIKDHVHVMTMSIFESLSQLFYQNIQACEKKFVSVEFCPITFNTQHIFYEKSFEYCINWSPLGGFPRKISPFPRHFQIFSEDITRIMRKQKKSNVSFVRVLDK